MVAGCGWCVKWKLLGKGCDDGGVHQIPAGARLGGVTLHVSWLQGAASAAPELCMHGVCGRGEDTLGWLAWPTDRTPGKSMLPVS